MLMKYTKLRITTVHNSTSPELTLVKIFDAGRKISYVLNSGVTKPNLT